MSMNCLCVAVLFRLSVQRVRKPRCCKGPQGLLPRHSATQADAQEQLFRLTDNIHSELWVSYILCDELLMVNQTEGSLCFSPHQFHRRRAYRQLLRPHLLQSSVLPEARGLRGPWGHLPRGQVWWPLPLPGLKGSWEGIRAAHQEGWEHQQWCGHSWNLPPETHGEILAWQVTSMCLSITFQYHPNRD